MTHEFSVVFICLLYLLKTKHVLSVEWKLQILVDRRKLQVALEQGSEGHPREAAVLGCNLDMWGTQLACPSVSCWMALIYQATVRQTSKQRFALLYTVLQSAVLSDTSMVRKVETWACLSMSLWSLHLFESKEKRCLQWCWRQLIFIFFIHS